MSVAHEIPQTEPAAPGGPFALTLEGPYMIKNIVLVSAAIVLGGIVRGGGLVPDSLPAAATSARKHD